MTYTMILWAFMYGFSSHETVGDGGVSSTSLTFKTLKECEDTLKTVQLNGKLGSDPYVNYQIVGQCIAH